MARLLFIVTCSLLCNILNISAVQPFDVTNIGELNSDNVNYRLPNNTIPEVYKVYISTDVANKNFGFSGMVNISVKTLNATNTIIVHQRQLNIVSAELMAEGGQYISIVPPHYDPVTEFLTIKTVNYTLFEGMRVFLSIKYNGTLQQSPSGFYRTSYYDSNGKERWLATTHFEPTYARHAFPCMDEPAMKATFEISIEHNSAYTAISNMPQANQVIMGSRTISHFCKTPLMSTYLIAFVVSNFAFKEQLDHNGLKHRVFVKPIEIENAYFSVNESAKILNAFSDYLQVNYSLPKMDQIAIPQLYFGAMENWGLVTYLEKYILYNEYNYSYNRKFNVVNLIAHEYSHQWFGNLVSPNFWNFIWLNEGFATLFENIGTDLVHPEFHSFDSFVTFDLQSVFKVDDKIDGTHPMTYYVEDPKAVAELFDRITYQKSGSVLRMFMHALGEQSFKKGLNYYLIKKSFQTAIDKDLFESLDRAAKEDNTLDKHLNVTDIFGSWSNQAGFPLLIVKRNYESDSIEISQERYLEKYPCPEANFTTWYIPYNFDTSNNVNVNDTSVDGWLPKGVKSMVINPNKKHNWTNGDWVLFNKQQTGFYRVLYDERNYKLIMNELKSGDINKIHPISRAQLLDDLSDFVFTKRLPVAMYFDLIQYLRRETEFAPWSSAMRSLFKIKHILVEGSKAYEKFRTFVADVVEPFYEHHALVDANENEPFDKNLIREIAVKLACEFKIESCLRDSKQLLETAIDSGYFASKNTRGLIYLYGIRDSNASFIDLIRKRLNSTNDEEHEEIWQSLKNLNSKAINSLSLLNGLSTRSQYEDLQAFKLFKDDFGKGCVLEKHHDLYKTLLTLSRNVYNNYTKKQFLSILTTMKNGKCLNEEQSKRIIDETNRALETSKSIRKLIMANVTAIFEAKHRNF